MEITRFYQELNNYLRPNKVLTLYGPRRVGKTKLIEHYLRQTSLKYKLVTGEDIEVQAVIGSSNLRLIKEYCQGYELIVIDEAQNIPKVGTGLKLMVDHIPGIHVIATGSSSFDLSNKIGEPLVGRQRILKLYPVSLLELKAHHNQWELNRNLEEYLIYGMYPEVLTTEGHAAKAEYLTELVNAYLLKDILAIENVKAPKLLLDLLRLLAYQVGSEVSFNELSNALKIDVKTVQRYIDLLEKSFLLYSLGGFSRNLRNEIVNKRKYYFYDTGIRNALIQSFNPLAIRNDKGLLWENFIFMERQKRKAYEPILSNDYFWRTYSQKEIDLIEERGGKLYGYEFKWSNKPLKSPLEWRKAYPDSEFELIHPENYFPFISIKS